jgi:acyl-CoA synthetase (AMP-forming)/AMP-acid ligase II
MLLYITTGEGHDREVRPLATIPDTLNELYQLGMREHARKGVVRCFEGDRWREIPDWRFDREVIQLALSIKEYFAIAEGDAVAILGPRNVLWLQADFAVRGLRAVPVGLQPALTDEQLVDALTESQIRVAIGTDAASADRLANLRPVFYDLETVLAPERESEPDRGIAGLHDLRAQGQILDTPERAANWRYYARQAQSEDLAGVQYVARAADGVMREPFTHGEAIAFVRDRLERYPAGPADVACFQGSEVTRASRLCCCAYVGDGYTEIALPDVHATDGCALLAPAKIVVSAGWLHDVSVELAAVSGLGQKRKRRRIVEARLGPAIRWIEPDGDLAPEVAARLAAEGLPLGTLVPGSV